ncbi:hypothetical protein SARI_03105 [Salmonella enterica subsp. arizonae serovar 62:z4,z23:-]|uniref:Uncharacterized protein n=1 Tax=Salmonella arizonae (strain ATCC BAA-731 / CDC346-86 / RSK2980) TaxID=41514 RepID=A9MS42_SALAR|nr:hypothetical protein SARI_03105 [Salmonella enterica subsp. arizonae serovar 62:z4,z23:-]
MFCLCAAARGGLLLQVLITGAQGLDLSLQFIELFVDGVKSFGLSAGGIVKLPGKGFGAPGNVFYGNLQLAIIAVWLRLVMPLRYLALCLLLRQRLGIQAVETPEHRRCQQQESCTGSQVSQTFKHDGLPFPVCSGENRLRGSVRRSASASPARPAFSAPLPAASGRAGIAKAAAVCQPETALDGHRRTGCSRSASAARQRRRQR